MSRRGWVSAHDEAGDWWVLSVYDDGWCAVPAAGRSAAGTRRQLNELVGGMVVVVGLFAAAAAVAGLAPSAVLWLSWVLLAGSVVAAVVAGVRISRARAADRPPVFESSAAHATAVDGAAHTPLGQVRAVAVGRERQEDVVLVRLRRGGPLAYRSPDRTLGRLFAPWTPTPPAG